VWTIQGKTHTLVAVGDDFVKRSDSISYLSTLKHSSLSSKNSAYVRTHAEQSQATRIIKLIIMNKKKG